MGLRLGLGLGLGLGLRLEQLYRYNMLYAILRAHHIYIYIYTTDHVCVQSQSLPDDVMSKLTTKWKELSKQRKKRAIPEDLTTKQAIGGWSEDKDFATTLHKVAAEACLCFFVFANT